MAKKYNRPNDHVLYSMKITNHAIGYSVRTGEDGEQQEHFNFDLYVELDEPIKGVSNGGLILYGTQTGGGGSINYDSDKYLHGCLWIGTAGAVALANLLNSGKIPRMHLWGNSLYRRSAIIRDVSWFTEGHSELEG